MSKKVLDVRKIALTGSAKTALDKLPIHKRAFVQKRIEGGTVAEASSDAGVSRRMGTKYDRQADIQNAYRELMQAAFPMPDLIKKIKGGTEATVPVYGLDGKKKKDRPDWKTRKPYIEMAVEHTGYFEKKQDSASTLIQVQVQHIGATVVAAKHITTAPAKADRITESLRELSS